MVDAFAIIERLSTYTLGGLVTLILIGSYFDKWVWGSYVRELKAEHAATIKTLKEEHATTLAMIRSDYEDATKDMQDDYEKRFLKYEASNNKWENIALKSVGLLEVGIVGLKKTEAP